MEKENFQSVLFIRNFRCLFVLLTIIIWTISFLRVKHKNFWGKKKNGCLWFCESRIKLPSFFLFVIFFVIRVFRISFLTGLYRIICKIPPTFFFIRDHRRVLLAYVHNAREIYHKDNGIQFLIPVYD